MKNILIISLILGSWVTSGQTDKELAGMKKETAIQLMDNGQPDQAIKLLEEAKKLDPLNYVYDYEIGLAWYIKNDYKKSLAVYKNVIKYKNADDQCYQMLGNLYDINGNPGKALKTYDQGLQKFPGSGRLYLEKGNVYWNQKKYGEALPFYEQGIETDPMFPSNYYRAALLYCSSSEVVWGMIYGEIFMNLERNSKRTSEVSNMLFECYRNQIKIRKDTITVSFSKNNVKNITDPTNLSNFKIPFPLGAYEPAILMSLLNTKEINIHSLDTIRTNFISNYYLNEYHTKYPNILFDYQKKIEEAGYLQPYNYWILMKGDEENFINWQSDNKELWESFVIWFTENALSLNAINKFYREQY